ncbi:MAG: hypothetical protein ACUVTD_08035 [Nitrososphaerales archaeon]
MNRITRKLVMIGSCLLLAILITVTFMVIALQTGKHSQMDIYLGAAWTFTLSLIVSSSLLIPRIRKKFGQ